MRAREARSEILSLIRQLSPCATVTTAHNGVHHQIHARIPGRLDIEVWNKSWFAAARSIANEIEREILKGVQG